MNATKLLKLSILRIISVVLLIAAGRFAISAANPPKALSDTMSRRINLQEVIVRPGHEHYSKRNNPAVDLMQAIRKNASKGDPRREPYYTYDRYERITLALNNIDDSIGSSGFMKKFDFLNQYVDTNVITGKPVLPLSVKEKLSTVYHRGDPQRTREVVTGLAREGMDEMFDEENMQKLLEEFFRETDLYQNDITLLANRFVSPLSAIGPDFYKYYLTDTISIPGYDERYIVLAFTPRNTATFGFTGRLFVAEGDTSMFVRRAVLHLPKEANVNFVNSFRLEQTFERDSVGNRHVTSDDLSLEFSVLPGKDGLYIRKLTNYVNHAYEPPADMQIFDRMAETSVRADAWLQPDSVWAPYRADMGARGEMRMAEMMEQMRHVPLYYWAERVIRAIITGYVPVARGVEVGPINTMLSFNTLEGARLRLGGITTAKLSPRWFGRAYVAYGTRDRRWKYRGEIEYSFREKKRHTREFPMHSIRLSHTYDIDQLGQNYAFTNPDNIFLSLKRQPDTLITYRRITSLQYFLELDNHFSVTASLNATRQEPSRYISFRFADGTSASHFNANYASLTLRYAPHEKFLQTTSERFPINTDYPIVMLTHTFGRTSFPGNGPSFTLNKTELSMQRRFWFSAFGYADLILKGAHVWGSVPFTQLIIPNANLSYTIQPESFALMSAMEFMFDSYASLDFTYWGNGVIFNYVPLLKKLKLREVGSFRMLWGHLSDRNNPALNTSLPLFPTDAYPVTMHGTPYMEISAGIDNLFKILRLDYVWRLSYRNTPGVDRSGLRVALHFTF